MKIKEEFNMKIKEKFINLIEKIINKNKENAEQKPIKENG